MRAEDLLRRASAAHGAETMRVVTRAFNDAWASIAGEIGSDPRNIEVARYNLATAVLQLARKDSRDADELKNAALYAVVRGGGKGKG